jgi:hypothetical protein
MDRSKNYHDAELFPTVEEFDEKVRFVLWTSGTREGVVQDAEAVLLAVVVGV